MNKTKYINVFDEPRSRFQVLLDNVNIKENWFKSHRFNDNEVGECDNNPIWNVLNQKKSQEYSFMLNQNNPYGPDLGSLAVGWDDDLTEWSNARKMFEINPLIRLYQNIDWRQKYDFNFNFPITVEQLSKINKNFIEQNQLKNKAKEKTYTFIEQNQAKNKAKEKIYTFVDCLPPPTLPQKSIQMLLQEQEDDDDDDIEFIFE